MKEKGLQYAIGTDGDSFMIGSIVLNAKVKERGVAERIDAHHHLWRYTAEEYGWIDDKMAALRRDFLPADLRDEMRAADIEGAVAVQARQTLDETDWLLELADKNEQILGVVGWAPIAEEEFAELLQALVQRPKLKGLRHIVQGEPDENYLLREDFNRGIRQMAGTGLVYDILIYERHLPQTIRFVDQHAEQQFVLDHMAKPRIREGVLEPWATNIHDLAKRENVACKLSGMVTEADWFDWTLEGLRPYLDVVMKAFGPKRVMAGSDWPVCLVACGYAQWFGLLEEYFAGYDTMEREAIFGGNASHVYRL
jgi:L-fuconolactonase